MTKSRKCHCKSCTDMQKTNYAECSSRLGSLPYLSNPLNKNQFILDENCNDPWVKGCIANYQNTIDGFLFNKNSCFDVLKNGLMGGEAEINEYEQGGATWPITYTFMPDELICILRDNGVKNIRLPAPVRMLLPYRTRFFVK